MNVLVSGSFDWTSDLEFHAMRPTFYYFTQCFVRLKFFIASSALISIAIIPIIASTPLLYDSPQICTLY